MDDDDLSLMKQAVQANRGEQGIMKQSSPSGLVAVAYEGGGLRQRNLKGDSIR